ncbi:phosphoenolpyruvate carboxylase [Methanoculleus chikugoensis]|uniref:phosphoenolpyruvate carboxylase n=1 Tax=Methanoculleus chikugoensis TaxID=118126 RepID=UPI001FB2CD9F|nr:phosphoenolpyruvate carboxylase [Methanoculleus chikugoensis]
MPERRKRKLHIGLFGYARSTGGITLPRAIKFTAALYSIGLPPEVLGLDALDDADIGFLRDTYINFDEDLRAAARFLNTETGFVPPGTCGEGGRPGGCRTGRGACGDHGRDRPGAPRERDREVEFAHSLGRAPAQVPGGVTRLPKEGGSLSPARLRGGTCAGYSMMNAIENVVSLPVVSSQGGRL